MVARAVYLKKADVVCERAYNRNRSWFQAFTMGKAKPFSTPAESVEYVETIVVPNRKRLVEELRVIGIPVDDEDLAKAILAAYEDGIRKVEEDPEGAVSSYVDPFDEAVTLAREYGLANCW